VARLLGFRRVPPRPHPSKELGSTTTTTKSLDMTEVRGVRWKEARESVSLPDLCMGIHKSSESMVELGNDELKTLKYCNILDTKLRGLAQTFADFSGATGGKISENLI